MLWLNEMIPKKGLAQDQAHNPTNVKKQMCKMLDTQQTFSKEKLLLFHRLLCESDDVMLSRTLKG